MTDESDPLCGCDHEYDECEVHVRCDTNCAALLAPVTVDELIAAVEHWRSHDNMGGCSHGN